MTSLRFTERVALIPRIRTSVKRSWFRWGSEKEREEAELRDLFNEAARAYAKFREGDTFGEIIARLPRDELAQALFCSEDYLFGIDAELEHLDLKQAMELRSLLRAQLRFLQDPEKTVEPLLEAIEMIVTGLAAERPEEGDSPFVVTLADIYGIDVIQRIIITFAQFDESVLTAISRTLYRNMCAASGVDPETEDPRLVMPEKCGLPPLEAARLYLYGTPFLEHFEKVIALDVPKEVYFSHMHVIGGSGAGKTQWLSELILYHAYRGASLVVVDSQGDLIDKLAHLRAVEDRCILIDPKDVEYPPQINIFDINRRFGQYDCVAREQVVAGAIQTLDFLFTGILGADLTAKQGVFFRLVSRLMLALPETMGRNATILDMLALMEDDRPYEAAIASLPPIQRTFFEQDFRSKTFVQTKEQIRYRLHAILENPTLERLFTAEETKLDIFAELNRGSVILVDTAKDFLKGTSAHFGQIFITLVLQAILERAALPERDRHPTFLVIDEAAEYFSQNIDDILTQCRKYRCGAVFAHQYLDQAASSLRASLAANTAIKMASAVSAIDARYLAPNLNTTADFIL
ncbi:MAG: type IV secretory system conjugative DNA transfer family protein, partial [Thermoanaerobaculia bacterium]